MGIYYLWKAVKLLSSQKYDVFAEHHIFDVVLQDGKIKRLRDREELNKYLYNPPNPIPETNEGKTWISNYVLTFWMPIMGVGAFTTYLQLSKMAFGDKTHAYPSVPYLAMMMGIDVKTVRKYIKILQDINFVVVVHVLDSRTGQQKTNLYMLANTIPYLSEKELEELPKRLQDEHEKFVESTKMRKRLTFD